MADIYHCLSHPLFFFTTFTFFPSFFSTHWVLFTSFYFLLHFFFFSFSVEGTIFSGTSHQIERRRRKMLSKSIYVESSTILQLLIDFYSKFMMLERGYGGYVWILRKIISSYFVFLKHKSTIFFKISSFSFFSYFGQLNGFVILNESLIRSSVWSMLS